MSLTTQQAKLEESNLRSAAAASAPLSVHVKKAVDHYFAQLNGHDTCDLYAMVIQEVEKPLLEATLAHSDFNQSKAAKALGLSRSTLRKKIAQYNINY